MPGNYGAPPQAGYGMQGGPGMMLDRGMVTTATEFTGYKVNNYLGIVRGITVVAAVLSATSGLVFSLWLAVKSPFIPSFARRPVKKLLI